ncbi:MAG: response regulator transcription factor [Candidatus Saganbacteria bacterium]|nr:response regulator transcription factor [Candidatus Saganbacteria bacterium]
MNSGAKILVIDDEKSIRRLLDVSLSTDGYSIYLAKTGKDGLLQFDSVRPDIVILDLGLPDMDGIDVLGKIRERSKTPVIILTVKGSDSDKVQLLDAGADDYLTKPFSAKELSVRVRVALRHSLNLKKEPVFESGPLKIDLGTRSVWINGELLKLTATEYDLLKILAHNEGRIVTQKHLLKEVWGNNAVNQSHYLRIYFGQLRKKLDKYSLSNIIITEPGVGYRLSIE